MSSYIKTEQYGTDGVQFLSSWKGLVLKTFEFPQTAGTAVGDKKIVKSGTVYKVTTGEPSNSTTYYGIVFGDVDVTDGANMGALMVGGRVYENRLSLQSGDKAGLQALGIFFDTAPAVTRP